MATEKQENELKKIEDLLKKNMAQIKSKILILSNKGGVGKSFISSNIAVFLSKNNKVGLMDADIHGPSIGKILGFEGERLYSKENNIIPYQINPNLVAVSMSSFIENSDTPLIWRGPLKMSIIRQFLAEVEWGILDYLIIDSPPGTGDEPLSICQLIPGLTGAIIVTTPQEIALLDSRKCVNFLRQLSIPILGIVENMSGFVCPNCGFKIDLFKSGGGQIASKELNVPFLGKIPFIPEVVESMDKGTPFVDIYPDSEITKDIEKICVSLPK
jgi:Mrp family chromosome partitioning ATPase